MQSCNIYLVINDKNICRIAWQFNFKPVFALAPSCTSRHLSINSFIYLSTFIFILYTCVLFLYFYPPKKQVENCYIHHSRVSFFQYDTNQILNCLLLGFPIA